MKRLSKLSLIGIFALTLVTVSCKEDKKTEEAETANTEQQSTEMKTEMTKSTETKYNPAHGEEGHRCDLPVGAPLSETANTTPVMNESPLRIKGATPQINPAHGEPGHDCSKPVGAQLN